MFVADTTFSTAGSPYLFEARQMQALSLIVHIPLVCFGVAFPAIVLFAEWRYLCTGDSLFRTLAKRWSKVMLALSAVGVVTGTILSFEFGLLWPSFMAGFGNVFGLAFVLEGFAFFLESIFGAIYVFGWSRLAAWPHFVCGIPIVIAGATGSLFVISANAWMNHPGGFEIRDGRAVNVRPLSALFENSFTWHEFVHMYFAAYIVAGFLVAGVYAWAYLRGRWSRYERTAMGIALSGATIAAIIQPLIGDWAARDVAEQQPVKLAAMEGLGHTTRGAPEHLLGWYDGQKVVCGIEIPRMLSILAFHNPNATVKGLDIVPPADRPPVNLVRIAFQTMVGIGTLLAFLSTIYLYSLFRLHRLPKSGWFYLAIVAAGPLSLVALVAGWVTTEVGRQPWVVYGFMRTSQAVTGAHGVPLGYAALVAVYIGLIAAVVWILRRLSEIPLDDVADEDAVPPSVVSAYAS